MEKFLIITAHDLRSARKTSVHFIAGELARLGPTKLFSLGFSYLSVLHGKDPRIGLEAEANQISIVDGIETYLWKTPLHPANPRNPWLQKLSPAAFEVYRLAMPGLLREWAAKATTIIVQAGVGVMLLKDLRRWNPQAQLIYLASDDLTTVKADPYLVKCLKEYAPLVTRAILPSRHLSNSVPAAIPKYFVPHGIQAESLNAVGPSPYGPGVHALSVGSMLFDPAFFKTAVKTHPDVHFHVMGSGLPASKLPPQVTYYPETPFQETLAYIKHASFGLAPYRAPVDPHYLSDTSLKLMQYGFFGVPAVCPQFAVGNHAHRFGYVPGDEKSINKAICSALAAGRSAVQPTLSWATVVERLLLPEHHTDNSLIGLKTPL